MFAEMKTERRQHAGGTSAGPSTSGSGVASGSGEASGSGSCAGGCLLLDLPGELVVDILSRLQVTRSFDPAPRGSVAPTPARTAGAFPRRAGQGPRTCLVGEQALLGRAPGLEVLASGSRGAGGPRWGPAAAARRGGTLAQWPMARAAEAEGGVEAQAGAAGGARGGAVRRPGVDGVRRLPHGQGGGAGEPRLEQHRPVGAGQWRPRLRPPEDAPAALPWEFDSSPLRFALLNRVGHSHAIPNAATTGGHGGRGRGGLGRPL